MAGAHSLHGVRDLFDTLTELAFPADPTSLDGARGQRRPVS